MSNYAPEIPETNGVIYSEDQFLVYGIKRYCSTELPGMKLVAAREEQEAIEAAENAGLLIVDLIVRQKFTFQFMERVRKSCPTIGMLAVSHQAETVCAQRCLMAGANGFINPSSSLASLSEAIRLVSAGDVYVSQQVQNRLLAGSYSGPHNPIADLTRRELEVFYLLGQGKPPREIAAHLDLSVKTIETYRDKVKYKLGFKTTHELTRYAFEASVFRFDDGHR